MAHQSLPTGTHFRPWEQRAPKPMITFLEASTRCSGDGTEIIISLDCSAGWIRSVVRTDTERTTGFPCSCLNAQMIGGIAVASRRLASLPLVGRFVALTIARWALWVFWARRVSFSLAKSGMATCYVHLLLALLFEGWFFQDSKFARMLRGHGFLNLALS